jgi:hypothetical protein
MWQGAYDLAADADANAAIMKLDDPLCHPN